MPILTQERFAELLRNGMAAAGMGGKELAQATGIDATTISRYRRKSYASGPPSAGRRRRLEQAMGLQAGFLDGVGGEPTVTGVAEQAPGPYQKRDSRLPEGADYRQVYGIGMMELAPYAERREPIPPEIAIDWMTRLFQAATAAVAEARRARDAAGGGEATGS